MAEPENPIKPFAFDRVFRYSAPTTRDEAHAASIAEMHDLVQQLEAELAEVRAERDEAVAAAHAAGLEQGLVQARGERAEAQLAATDALHAAFDELSSEFASVAEQMTRDCADVALKAAEFLAGHAEQIAPLGAVEAALDRVLDQVAFGTVLRMRVHPDSLVPFEQMVAVRAGRHAAKPQINVVSDAAIGPQDAHISWAQGGLIVDAAERRAAVMQELSSLLDEGAN